MRGFIFKFRVIGLLIVLSNSPAISHAQLAYCVSKTLTGNARVKDIAWSPDGKNLASVDKEAVRIWDINSGKIVNTIRDRAISHIESVSWSPDGKLIAFLGSGIAVWNIETGTKVDIFEGQTDGANGGTVAWSINGDKLAFVRVPGDGYHRVQVWDKTTNKIKTIGSPVGNVPITVWGTQNRLFISDAIRIEIWNTQSNRRLVNFKGLIETWSIALSSDGTLLAGGNASYVYQLSTIQIWNVSLKNNTAQLVTALQGHMKGVVALSWKPNTGMLASGSQDTSIRIWDVATKQSLLTLNAHTATVNAVKWSPTEPVLASASDDGTINIWHEGTACVH